MSVTLIQKETTYDVEYDEEVNNKFEENPNRHFGFAQ